MDYAGEDDGALMLRRRAIVPSLEICAKNCLNWDAYQRCPIFLKGRQCSSWRPIDLGDEELVEEDRPFVRESLGGADVKQSKHSIEPPKEEVDAEGEGEEEIVVEEIG